MDVIEVIMNALALGAAGGLKDAASETIKDLRGKLKSMISARFNKQPDAAFSNTVLTRYEEEPETWDKPLRNELVKAHVAEDAEIVETAQRLLQHINPQQVGMGKYNTQIAGSVTHFQQGDDATMNIGTGNPSDNDPNR